MKRNLLSVLVAAIFIAGAVLATAQDAPRGMGQGHKMPEFSDCDLDGNGVIDATEFYEARGKRMAEHAAAGGKMKNVANAPSFEDIDTDGNGEVGPEEFAAHQAEMIEKRQGKQSS